MDLKKEMGNRLKLARSHKSKLINKKYTGQMLADELGVSRGFIGDMESGRTPIPSDMIEKIAKICELPKDFFQVKYNDSEITKENIKMHITENNTNSSEIMPITINDIVNIPIVGIIRAGQPILAIENIEGYLPVFKSSLCSDKEYFGLKVNGDSMNLEFQDGTILLVERTSVIENGEIAVVLINGDAATVKKIVSNKNEITLIPMSTNPNHKIKTYNIIEDQVKILGKVKQATKMY